LSVYIRAEKSVQLVRITYKQSFCDYCFTGSELPDLFWQLELGHLHVMGNDRLHKAELARLATSAVTPGPLNAEIPL